MPKNWPEFLKAVEREPKAFAKAIITYLDPPKYAVEQLKSFDWMCYVCWKPRVDQCFNCDRSVCDEHAKLLIGPKTKLEWRLCSDCLKTGDLEEYKKKMEKEDEELWQEDQEEEKDG